MKNKKMLLIFAAVLAILLFAISGAYAQPDTTYVKGVALFKIKNTVPLLAVGKSGETVTTGITWLDALSSQYSFKSLNPVMYVKTTDDDLKRIYRVSFSDDQDVLAVVASLAANGDVEYAEPCYIYQLNAAPNDARFAEQWALKKLHAEAAWDINKGSNDVVIGIIDTGIDLIHQDLQGNLWTNADEIPGNGFDDDNNGFIDDVHGYNMCTYPNAPYDPIDLVGHGSHCSGIAAAITNNSEGIAGLAGGWYGTTEGCRIMPVRTFGTGVLDTIINSIQYAADNGADVISMSFSSYSYSSTLKYYIDKAHNKGCVLVASASNEGVTSPVYPAAYDFCIAVAATDENDNKAIFSNYGDWVDVAAPGVNILSTINGQTYGLKSGTSMATPYVAGLAGLIKSQFPSLTNQQIKERILGTADNVCYKTYETNFTKQQQIGSGRLNAYKALSVPAPRPSIAFWDARCSNPENYDIRQIFNGSNKLAVWLKNNWINAKTATAVLRAEDPAVIITQPSADFSGIVMYAINNNQTTAPFELNIDASFEYGRKVKFYLDITVSDESDVSYTQTDSFEMEVGSPQSAGFPVYLGGSFRGSPNSADLDGDNHPEIVIGTTSGGVFAVKSDGSIFWSFVTGGEIYSTPAIGDVTGDNVPEVAVISQDGYLYVLSNNGSLLFSKMIGVIYDNPYGYDLGPSAVMTDVDGDGQREIVTDITDGHNNPNGIVAYKGNGNVVWRADWLYPTFATPASGDINGDGCADVLSLVHESNGFLYATNGKTGALLWKVQLVDGINMMQYYDQTRGPVLCDLNQDGKLEVICSNTVQNLGSMVITVVDNNGQILWKKSMLTNSILSTPSIMDINNDGFNEIVFVNETSLFALDKGGEVVVNTATDATCFSTPVSGGYNGVNLSLAVGSNNAKATHVNVGSFVQYQMVTREATRSTALWCDFDGDSKADVIAGDNNGYLYSWKTSDSVRYEWPSLRHDQYNSGNYHTGRPLTSKSTDAMAYNNSRKMVYDIGWQKYHLVYTSSNKILYTTSQDPQNGWDLPVCLGDGQYPAVALDNEPQANIVWSNTTNEGLVQLCGQRIGEAAPTVIKELGSISFDNTISCSPPSIAVKADTVHLVYLFSHSGGIPPNVLCTRIVMYAKWPVGKYAEYQEQIIDSWEWNPLGPAPRSPSICIDNKGCINLAWEKTSTVEEPGDIWWTLRYVGGTWHHKENISQSYGIPSVEPSLYTYGNVHLAWEENGEIFYRECVNQLTPLTDIPDQQWDPYVWGAMTNVSQTPASSSLQPVFSDNYLTFMEQIGSDYEVMLYAKQNGSWLPVDGGNISQSPLKNSYYPHLCTYDGIYLHGIWSEGNDWGLGLNSFQKEAPATALYQTNVGDSLPTPYTVQRDGYIAYGATAKSKANVVTVDYDTTELIYQVNGLNTNKKHTLDINLYQVNPTAEKWQYTVLVDDIPIQTLWVPSATPTRVTKLVPDAATKDSVLRIRIVKKKGDIVTCDWWQLFEDKKSNGGAQSAETLPFNGFVNALYQNAPNPCGRGTVINYQLAKTGQVNIKVYNTLGQVVKTIVNASLEPGYHTVKWDGKDEAGRQASSGIYFYRLASNEFNSTKKMVVLR